MIGHWVTAYPPRQTLFTQPVNMLINCGIFHLVPFLRQFCYARLSRLTLMHADIWMPSQGTDQNKMSF